MIEFEHIHWKMLFDSINESLNKYRPYGEQGVPMPWCSSLKWLCSNDILNFGKIFCGIKDNLKSLASVQAGAMPKMDYVNKFTG